MSGASVGCSQPRPCSGGKTLRRCRTTRESDNVVLIDVDSDSLNNVIIIDVPESLKNKFRASSVLRNGGNGPWATVICLDDDDSTDDNNANTGGKVDENGSNAASSSKRACPVSGNFASSSNSVADDCQFIQENVSPVKLSKGKRTYSGKGSTIRYGLSADIESGSSDSDYLDCELMEGPFGRLREQWEKAYSKRKCDTRNVQSGTEDPEMVFGRAHRNNNAANEHGQPEETAFVEPESKQKKATADSIPNGDGNLDCSYPKSKKAVVENDDHLQSKLGTQFPDGKANPPCRRDYFTEKPPLDNSEHHSGQYFEKGSSSFCNEEAQMSHRPYSFPGHEWGTGQLNHAEKIFQSKEKPSVAEPDQSRVAPCGEMNLCNGKTNLVEKEPFLSECQRPVHEVDHGKPVSRDEGKISQGTINENSTTNTNGHVNEVRPISVSPNEGPVKLVLNSGDDMLNSEDCIFSEREKLKETDEYKKALEEEWASRQRALQIQVSHIFLFYTHLLADVLFICYTEHLHLFEIPSSGQR